MTRFRFPAWLAIAACTGTGEGTAKFTTWGEELIEKGIPAATTSAASGTSTGFTDGWSVRYTKFLVAYHAVTVADAAGHVAARMETPRFVDNTKPGVKELIAFSELDAKAYSRVSYEIKPALPGALVVGGAEPGDLAMMVAGGYSMYVEGRAVNGARTKTFRWGFKTQTHYADCHSAEENGSTTEGIVLTSHQTDESQLTTHGDHLFYDRLQTGDSAQPTRLRFEEKAAADADHDGEVTLGELCRTPIGPAVYNTSGLPGATLGDFVISLARTVGHFRSEGECTVTRIDPVPAGVVNPCDEY